MSNRPLLDIYGLNVILWVILAQGTLPVGIGIAMREIDGVIVMGEVDWEGQGVAVAVLLIKHGLVTVVPEIGGPVTGG